jgi:ArsR family transcriptional regulator
MKTRQAIPAVDKMFRAFSDRTRLRILNLLRGGETCVCDLQAVLDVPQPKVSRHLAYLRRAGLVSARKQGLWSYYSLAPARGAFHGKLLECLGCCFTDVPELADDVRRLRRSGPDCCNPSSPASTSCCGG